ncbi:MAG: hypothetical protein HZA01_14875 [Nitrospinae bacterium]|nr:hypothetical protein [Nitrospinota bacterium]
MVTQMSKKQKNNGALGRSAFFFALGLIFCLGPALAGADQLSEHHYLKFDPHTQKMVDAKVFKEINNFFHDAEAAIEAKNMDALMGLYSDSYINGPHNKESVKKIWESIFSNFSGLATIHNMRFITTSAANNVMIIRCSGILMGIPKGEDGLIALDNWVDNDHVLVNEDGKWRLMGSSGKEQKRFWFDKPLHPLF